MPANRRTFLKSAAGAATLPFALKTLSASAQSTPAASPAAGGGLPSFVGSPEAQLEVFSWWTSGGEHDGLQQLFNAFSSQAPSVKIIDAAVAGGAGSNAKTALQTRLQGGQAPDSWQSHLGKELQDLYVKPGYCVSMADLYAEQGWDKVIPQGVLAQTMVDNVPYVVPVGNHRGNVLFYNKQVMEKAGVTVGDTMSVDDFFAACDKLKAAGIPALALGDRDSFAAPMLFENMLMARLGPDAYTKLWSTPDDWRSDGVKQAADDFKKSLGYLNPDHAALTWDGAADLVGNGTAGFTSMGDWAYGEFVAKKTTENIGWVAHPGSEQSFSAVIDGFVLPKGAPDPVNAANWLRTVGSAQAQTTFAPYKGCIPARTDVDTSTFTDYQKWSAKGFATATAVPSNAHGAAASPPLQQAIFDATIQFVVSQDTDTYLVTIQQAAQDDASNG